MLDKLFTIGDVAKEADVTPQAVRVAFFLGRIKSAGRTVGGVRLFTREAVDAFKALRQQRLEENRKRRAARQDATQGAAARDGRTLSEAVADEALER